jgi:diaminopimelate epimerase
MPRVDPVRFTKMQGAGNDVVLLDAVTDPRLSHLGPRALRRLGDRHFGVGADQILVVEPGGEPGVDFRYRIFNGASGDEVEHCGNGARCFLRYVRERGLTNQREVRVRTVNNQIELVEEADGRVRVDMNAPIFELDRIPFDGEGLLPRPMVGAPSPDDRWGLWPLDVAGRRVELAVLSMGNPHAVLNIAQWSGPEGRRGADVDAAPVAALGPLIERHPRFARKVNVGFLQVASRTRVRLRVFERDAGETLACGTGACAAVVAGIRLGWLDERVDVETRGGLLTIAWKGSSEGLGAHVFMTGPAETVFHGEIALEDLSA